MTEMLIERGELDYRRYLASRTFPKGSIVTPGEMRERVESYVTPMGISLPWARVPLKLRAREWTIWGGYTSHGKTSAMLHAVLHAMSQGKRVAVANLEHGAEETILALQLAAGCGGDPMRTDSFYELADDRLKLLNVQGSLTPEEAFTFCWLAAEEWACDLVVIDNLAALSADNSGPMYLSSQKRFALELNGLCMRHAVHLVLVAHGRKPQDGRPMGLYEVCGTSDLVNIAWNVVVVHRNIKRQMNPDDAAGQEDGQFIVWKQRRGGDIGIVKLWRDVRTGQFTQGDEEPIRYV